MKIRKLSLAKPPIPHEQEMRERRVRQHDRISDLDICFTGGRRAYRASRKLEIHDPQGMVVSTRPIGAQPVLFVGKAYPIDSQRERNRRLVKLRHG